MIRAPLPEQARRPVPAAGDGAIHPLEALRLLRSAGAALLAQAMLHGQLARVEWAEEKARLLRMLAMALLGFACLLCTLLFAGAVLLAACWDTPYRVPAALLLLGLYGLGVSTAWRRFRKLSALSESSFAATRDELASDLALLKSRL